MDVLVPIGEFSKMTYLSVKALRHYHDVGLLEPAAIDPGSGYRLYSPTQIQVAHAIRRFRDLDMPLEHIRVVLEAPDTTARNEAILTHLEQMQEQLERTRLTVASLQALLAEERLPGEVERRAVPPLEVLGISDVVAFEDCSAWLADALEELHEAATGAGIEVTGPDGALYTDAFFQEGSGAVTAFVPVAGVTDATALPDEGDDRPGVLELSAARFAVMVHDHPFDELDRTYGLLGAYVNQHGIGRPGPIREHYLADDRAEVCWPIDDRPTGHEDAG